MIKWKSGKTQIVPSVVPNEHAITIYLNNKLLATLMASLSQVKELVVGFLYSENIIDSPREIVAISVNQDKRKAQVWVEANIKEVTLENRIMTSGCGRGLTFLCPSDIEGVEQINSNVRVKPEEIIHLAKKMLVEATSYRASGGLHSCALCSAEEIVSFSEDIGRHNTIDKVLGDCLVRRITLTDKIILSTGRISSEMLLKAFRTKIPIVCSLSSPTDLTVELGEKLGITVIGYIRADGMKVYTHPVRVSFNPV